MNESYRITAFSGVRAKGKGLDKKFQELESLCGGILLEVEGILKVGEKISHRYAGGCIVMNRAYLDKLDTRILSYGFADSVLLGQLRSFYARQPQIIEIHPEKVQSVLVDRIEIVTKNS